MKFILPFLLLLTCLAMSAVCEESEEDPSTEKESWWKGFKGKVKDVFRKWTEDIRQLWDDVLVKARGMRSWTSDMFESLKKKMKEWVESRPEVPDDEKNEIETFISKLKVPTDRPKIIEP